jgi:macrolide-specific efflux system membrane fusion protein
MKKKWRLIFFVLLLMGGGIIWWQNSKKTKGHTLETSTLVKALQGPIEETVEATGQVAPLNRVEIKPPIQGRIEKLLVDEGTSVRAGQILAWMSSTDRAAILDAARAKGEEEYQRWNDAYKPTPIIAPLSGVIILRNVVVGQTVEASTVLYAMSDRLIVVAQVDEADIGRVHMNMPARITLDAYPDQVVDGHVFEILHEGKNVSNVITYDVKIEPKQVPSVFRSQMTANIALIVTRKENVVLVPASAVRDSHGTKQVMVPDAQGKPVAHDVDIGIENGEKSEILSGLNAGDQVFVMRARYVPQQGPQSSPLTFGGRPSSSQGGQGGGRRP